MGEEFSRRLLRELASLWAAESDQDRLELRLRPDGLADVRVISLRFAGLSDPEREALFWSAIRHLSADLRVRMTRCLLLSPEEAATYPGGDAAACEEPL